MIEKNIKITDRDLLILAELVDKEVMIVNMDSVQMAYYTGLARALRALCERVCEK